VQGLQHGSLCCALALQVRCLQFHGLCLCFFLGFLHFAADHEFHATAKKPTNNSESQRRSEVLLSCALAFGLIGGQDDEFGFPQFHTFQHNGLQAIECFTMLTIG
jgi:hypothetical protein